MEQNTQLKLNKEQKIGIEPYKIITSIMKIEHYINITDLEHYQMII